MKAAWYVALTWDKLLELELYYWQKDIKLKALTGIGHSSTKLGHAYRPKHEDMSYRNTQNVRAETHTILQ